jgi:O-antigen/teichoic acid export membrane protein
MIYIFNYWFLKLWVGELFFIGQYGLLLSVIVMFQLTFLHVEVLCLFGIGAVKPVSLLGLAEAFLNIGLTVWLGKIYGVEGVLLATIIAGWSTVMWAIPYIIMKKLKIRLKEYLLKPILFPVFGISCFSIMVYFFVNQLLKTIELNWMNFIAVAGVTGTLTFAFVWIFFLRKELSDFIPVRFKKYLFISNRAS